MTTMRSLFVEAVTAGWISRNPQTAKNRSLSDRHRFACLAVSFWTVPVGRLRYPLLRAREISRLATVSEFGRQTTRTRPWPSRARYDLPPLYAPVNAGVWSRARLRLRRRAARCRLAARLRGGSAEASDRTLGGAP